MSEKFNENEFNSIKNELKEVQNQASGLRDKEYTLNNRYVELLQEKCKENIGRCFKVMQAGKIISYCKIIDIDRPVKYKTGNIVFDDYHYPALWFGYPYKGGEKPFSVETVFSGAWGKGHDMVSEIMKITYQEITKEEFQEKLNEVNSAWMNVIMEL